MQKLRNFYLILSLGCCLLSVMFLSGCISLPKKEGGSSEDLEAAAALEVQDSLEFADIPVPSGFKLLNSESYSFEGNNIRVALLRYTGRPKADSVFKFFKQQMPLHDWNFINAVGYNPRVLNFQRETEICTITIEPKAYKTKVTICIGPKGKTGYSKNN
jgi:hypothetical protein